MDNTLYIVIPCYNEEEIFEYSNKLLNEKLNNLISNKKISNKSKILYVNDGSKDNTLNKIKIESINNSNVKYISLSKNYGQAKAIWAGLEKAVNEADFIVTMDFDLQDDINIIDIFIDEYKNGNEIVFGVRDSRKTDTIFKRNTALFFYKIMKSLKTNIIYNHSEFRLMSKKSVQALLEYKESNIFLRGMVADLGFKYKIVKYDRAERKKGKSKYSINKMLELTKEGITSFSSEPLKIITRVGGIIFFLSIVYCIYALIGYFTGKNVMGWTTIVGLICLFGGFQILCIGIIGEYIAKIYIETKRRPKYIIEETNM